jgi:hypothetical protein
MNLEEAARAWDVLWRDQKDDVATRAGVIRSSAFTRDLPYWNGVPLQWREPLRATLEADLARRKAAEAAQAVEIEKKERAELARLIAKYGTTQETPAAPKCDCEGPQKIGPDYHAPYCSTVAGGKELREQLERDSLNRRV